MKLSNKCMLSIFVTSLTIASAFSQQQHQEKELVRPVDREYQADREGDRDRIRDGRGGLMITYYF